MGVRRLGFSRGIVTVFQAKSWPFVVVKTKVRSVLPLKNFGFVISVCVRHVSSMAVGQNPGTPVNTQKAFKKDFKVSTLHVILIRPFRDKAAAFQVRFGCMYPLPHSGKKACL